MSCLTKRINEKHKVEQDLIDTIVVLSETSGAKGCRKISRKITTKSDFFYLLVDKVNSTAAFRIGVQVAGDISQTIRLHIKTESLFYRNLQSVFIEDVDLMFQIRCSCEFFKSGILLLCGSTFQVYCYCLGFFAGTQSKSLIIPWFNLCSGCSPKF